MAGIAQFFKTDTATSTTTFGRLQFPQAEQSNVELNQDLGINARKIRSDLMRLSITNPDAYLKAMDAEYDRTDALVRQTFNERYRRFIELGLPVEEAKRKAIAFARKYGDELEKNIHSEFRVGELSKVKDGLALKTKAKNVK